jgi:hypothetical protein
MQRVGKWGSDDLRMSLQQEEKGERGVKSYIFIKTYLYEKSFCPLG